MTTQKPLWWLTKDGDLDCLELYERHYSAYPYKDGRERKLFTGPGENSSYEPSVQTPCSSGASLSTDAQVKPESTARSSETSQRIKARNSYVKRIKLLMSSGLIAGITPTSVRNRSNQKTLDFAFSKQAGIGSNNAPETD